MSCLETCCQDGPDQHDSCMPSTKLDAERGKDRAVVAEI